MNEEEALTPTVAGTCSKHGRFWAVTDPAGRLVCLAVYKKGGQEVLRRLGIGPTKTETKKIRTGQRGPR